MISNVKDTSTWVKLDKNRNLRFDMNAFIELEDKFGSIQDALDALQKINPEAKAKKGQKRQDLKIFRTFLWAGLVHEDEALTEKDVGKLVDLNNIGEVANAIMSAVDAALPEVDEEDIKNSQSPA